MNLGARAEKAAKVLLENEFGQAFSERKLPVGESHRSFDLVSDNATVISQVKSCQKQLRELTPPQIKTRFQRDYLFDCLLLEKAKSEAKTRIFYLVSDKALFDRFVSWSHGLVDDSVQIRFIDFEKIEGSGVQR